MIGINYTTGKLNNLCIFPSYNNKCDEFYKDLEYSKDLNVRKRQNLQTGFKNVFNKNARYSNSYLRRCARATLFIIFCIAKCFYYVAIQLRTKT